MDVANPFLWVGQRLHLIWSVTCLRPRPDPTYMMLSLYLMTTAVIKPPNVWVNTVPRAHPLKLLKLPITFSNHDAEAGPEGMTNIGKMAGTSEKSDSCEFRIHRSGAGPLPPPPFRIYSKYTPANPEVMHAAVTAMNPLKGCMVRSVMMVGGSGISDRS